MSLICQHMNLIHPSCCQSLKRCCSLRNTCNQASKRQSNADWSKNQIGLEFYILRFIAFVFSHLISAAKFLTIELHSMLKVCWAVSLSKFIWMKFVMVLLDHEMLVKWRCKNMWIQSYRKKLFTYSSPMGFFPFSSHVGDTSPQRVPPTPPGGGLICYSIVNDEASRRRFNQFFLSLLRNFFIMSNTIKFFLKKMKFFSKKRGFKY